MKVPIQSNVVPLPRNRDFFDNKNASSGSDDGFSQPVPAAQSAITAFPRDRKAATLWSKALKLTAHSTNSATPSNGDSNQSTNQTLFGSLFVQVENHLVPQKQARSAETIEPNETVSSPPPSSVAMQGRPYSSTAGTVEPKADDVGHDNALMGPEMTAAPMHDGAQKKVLNIKLSSPSIGPSDPNLGSVVLVHASFPVGNEPVVGGPQKALNVGGVGRLVLHSQELPNDSPNTLSQADVTTSAVASEMDQNSPRNGDDHSPAAALAAERRRNGQVSSVSSGTVSNLSASPGSPTPSPAAQIVENIRDALPVVRIAPQVPGSTAQVQKTLEIQLQPEGLGTITLLLKSEPGKLKVQISARLETTRRELERSSQELVTGLRSVDASVRDVEVNFSQQNHDAFFNQSGQTFENDDARQNLSQSAPGSDSKGGENAGQRRTTTAHPANGETQFDRKTATGDLPHRVTRTDGIYL